MDAAGKTVFVSYSHAQEDWVVDRLVPCLKAAGAEVLIDRERFKAGKAVVGQMDAVQDRADIHVPVFSPEYVSSAFCTHEMNRAIAKDPAFTQGIVIPLVRADCKLPAAVTGPDPLQADLRDDKSADSWRRLLGACHADLGTEPVHWLQTRDEIRQILERDCSANLVVTGAGLAWRGMVDDLAARPTLQMTRVDLQDPQTIERPGLLGCMLSEGGLRGAIPCAPRDLVEFQRAVLASPTVTRVALLHFGMVQQRDYGADYFATIHHLASEARKLVLLIQSHAPFMSLLRPEWRTIMSQIMPSVVELRGRP